MFHFNVCVARRTPRCSFRTCHCSRSCNGYKLITSNYTYAMRRKRRNVARLNDYYYLFISSIYMSAVDWSGIDGVARERNEREKLIEGKWATISQFDFPLLILFHCCSWFVRRYAGVVKIQPTAYTVTLTFLFLEHMTSYDVFLHFGYYFQPFLFHAFRTDKIVCAQ